MHSQQIEKILFPAGSASAFRRPSRSPPLEGRGKIRKETALPLWDGKPVFLPALKKMRKMQGGDIFLQKRKKCGFGFSFLQYRSPDRIF
jgi:hypothetical protein